MALFPAGMLTTGTTLAHLQEVWINKQALDQLWKKFVFRQPCEKFTLPQNSGRTARMHRYTNLSPSLTSTTEGNIGSSLTLSSRTVSVTVSQFTSFITVSDLMQATAIDDQIAAAAKQLGYRAGYSVDNLARGVFDSESGSTAQTLVGSNITVSDFRVARHTLQAADVQPVEDGQFLAFIHPYVSYDLVNDPAAMGLADISKYTKPEASVTGSYNDRGFLANAGGCKIVETTNVYSTTISSVNYYRTYIFGKGGVGCVDLEGFGPSNVNDPKKENFKINVIRANSNNLVDPEGLIAGSAAYKFVTGVAFLDGPDGIGGTYRVKTIDAPSSIA